VLRKPHERVDIVEMERSTRTESDDTSNLRDWMSALGEKEKIRRSQFGEKEPQAYKIEVSSVFATQNYGQFPFALTQRRSSEEDNT
jgi:hypothetical protein